MTDIYGGKIVPSTINTPKSEDKYPKARTLAAAFWASYFALHWLLILEVVEMSLRVGLILVMHFMIAGALTCLIAADEVKK
jgi:hypothetical protein